MDTLLSAADQVFARIDRELWVVTSGTGERRGGLIATFISNASLVDSLPRTLLALAKQHHTRHLIDDSRAFGLHLIAARQLDWVWNFGLGSGRDRDKLAGYSVEYAATGVPLLSDALAWLDCRVETTLDTGDRTVYIAEVLAARTGGDEPPLTMRELLRIAPAERLRDMDEMRQRDSEIDAQAILEWRRERARDT